MDELEQEYPLMHPEYSPVLAFLYQNLPFVSILIGAASNVYAINKLRNAVHLPIRGLAMLWCSCNLVSILVVESLFSLELYSEGWYLGDFVCRLSKSFAMVPVCVNPWFLVAAVVSFSKTLHLRGCVSWTLALLIIIPITYMFYAFGHMETDFEEHNLTISSCVHAVSRDEFYWTNILSFVFYYNTPVAVILCFLVFSYQLQQNKTSDWTYCFHMLCKLFLAQILCWFPHWLDLFYLLKANDDFSSSTLAFLLVEVLVFVHIGIIVPQGLVRLAMHCADYSVQENFNEPSVVEMQGVHEDLPRDWP